MIDKIKFFGTIGYIFWQLCIKMFKRVVIQAIPQTIAKSISQTKGDLYSNSSNMHLQQSVYVIVMSESKHKNILIHWYFVSVKFEL